VLLRDDGAAKLVDLGIATAADATRITRSGVVLGSAAYMAPEQVAGHAATPASDVYALALVAFEALSGRRARSGRTPLEIAERAAAGSPPDLREAWPAAPPTAADVLRRALAHDPERRPRSAGALAGLLAGALRPGPARPGGRAAASHGAAARGRAPGHAPTELRAAAPPSAVPVTRAVRRRRAPELVAAAALALTTLSVAAVVALSHGGAGERPPDRAVAKRQRPASSPDRLRALAYAPATSQATTAQPPAAPPAQTAPAPSAEPSSQAAPPATSPTPPATSPSTHSTPERAAPRAGATLGAGASLNQRDFELMGRGSYRQAVRVLRRAVDAFPAGTRQLDYAYALYNLGRSLRLSGRGKQAVPVLKRRLAIPNQTAVVRRELDAARAKHNARARAERKRAR
jgi:eukaryotic-like serine/threonine-protein kinase